MFELRSPLQGTIVRAAAPGSTVAGGAEVVVLESMKMEIPVVAPAAGTVVEVLVAPEDRIDEGQVVAVLDTD